MIRVFWTGSYADRGGGRGLIPTGKHGWSKSFFLDKIWEFWLEMEKAVGEFAIFIFLPEFEVLNWVFFVLFF